MADRCDNCGREYDESIYYRCPECNPYNAETINENEYVLSPLIKVRYDLDGYVRIIDTGDGDCEVLLSHNEYKLFIEIIKDRLGFE